MINYTFKNANILIVDDEISNVELLEDLLEQTGYVNVISTTDSRKVTELFTSFQPDLILLDLMMPYMNGYEVMNQLKTVIPLKTYLPILVLTADVRYESKSRALSGGAKDFLSKPFELSEVVMRIRNLLETRYLHQLLEKQNNNLALTVKKRTRELEEANCQLLAKNQELEMLDKAKLEFLNIISHEIRTPLNGIKGFTGLLKNRIDSPQLLEFLNYLEISTDRLEKFSYQALLIAELRTKIYHINPEDISILMLLEHVNKNLEIKINKKNIQVEFQKDAELSSINADLRLIQICFECLIDNAVKYSHANSIIVVNAYFDKNQTVVEFIDSGVGFSDTALKKIFSFFGVGDKHIDQNTGLNLAIVKLIMNVHRGDIKVTNNKSGGATVKLFF